MSIVSYVKIEKDTVDLISKAIDESLRLIKYSFSKGTKNVVIKPNLCYYWDYSTGQTTDPKFVGALIKVIREQVSPKVNISIVESDASAMKCNRAFRLLGYEKLAKEYNVNLENLSEDKTTTVQTTVNDHQFDLMIPKTIQDADLRINVPKIKYMGMVTVSGAMKNIFGCNPAPKKFKLHPILDESIIAINRSMRFDLHVLDGIILLGTLPCRLNLVMATEDPVAFDVAASKIAGENPRKIRFISLAQKEGLGNMSYTTTGERPEVFEKNFMKKKTRDKLIASAYAFAVRTGIFKSG